MVFISSTSSSKWTKWTFLFVVKRKTLHIYILYISSSLDQTSHDICEDVFPLSNFKIHIYEEEIYILMLVFFWVCLDREK